MSEYIVATTADLLAAAKIAVAGDVIKLSAGTYSGVNLKSINPAGNVTITSADASKPAVFTDMSVTSSSNLSISNVVMQVQTTSTAFYDFQISSSSNVTVSNSVFNGTGMDPAVDTTGLIVRNSTGVSVTNSEFKNLVYGVSFLNNTKISVTNSSFHDLRVDGIRGGGNSDVYYGYNYFTNFHPRAAEHADAIQFWTTGTTASASNLTVEGNVYVRGETGAANVHGIFFRDDQSLPFKNVTVKDNLVVGAEYNGLSLEGVTNGIVTGNSVIAQSDADSWLRTLNNTADLQVFGNIASKFVTQYNELADNTLTGTVTDGGLAALKSWSLDHKLAGSFAGWADLATVSGLTWSTTAALAPAVVTDLFGTTGVDTLYATDAILSVYGLDGNDTLQGNGKAALHGGAGNDRYDLKLVGDTVVEDAGNGIDWVYSWYNHTLAVNVENLTLMGTATSATGNALDNRIYGSASSGTLHGLAGNDQIWGNDGNDALFGGLGSDMLNGGNGADRLNGGAGKDSLTGGAGNDVFVYGADSMGPDMDTITDFKRGYDKIDLSAIDAISRTTANDAFRFIGTKAFTGKGGEVKAVAYMNGTMVVGDTNGDGIADFSIMVQNVSKLAATDFIL